MFGIIFACLSCEVGNALKPGKMLHWIIKTNKKESDEMRRDKMSQMQKPSRLRRELFAAKRNSQRGFFESIGASSFYMTTDEMETSLNPREYERLISMVEY